MTQPLRNIIRLLLSLTSLPPAASAALPAPTAQIIESAEVAAWGAFVRRLKETPEGDGTLLDHTMVLLTSNLGNASAHDNKNMPVIFAGGGLRHGQHLAFDRKNNEALPKLYVSALQRLGLETDKFSTTTGTMPGLELV